MKLYLDDERELPGGFDRRVKTAAEAVALLAAGGVTLLSLDHDLGPPEAGTGYDVCRYVEEAAWRWAKDQPGGLPPLKLLTHTANPVGRTRMEWAISRANQFWAIGAKRRAGTLAEARPVKPRAVDGYTPTGTEYQDWPID